MEQSISLWRSRALRLRSTCPTVCLLAVVLFLLAAQHARAQGVASLKSLVVDKAGNPLEYAVVSLHGAEPMWAAPSTVAVIDQRNLQFAPTVVAVQMGTQVSFPNQDDVRHHVYSFSHPNAFELKLYHGEKGNLHRFEHPGIVVLGCNIHDGMLGYLRVVDSPWFGTSGADGVVNISGVPAGSYRMQIWHPDQGMSMVQKSVTLGDGKFSVRLALEINQPAPVQTKKAHPLQSLFRK